MPHINTYNHTHTQPFTHTYTCTNFLTNVKPTDVKILEKDTSNMKIKGDKESTALERSVAKPLKGRPNITLVSKSS